MVDEDDDIELLQMKTEAAAAKKRTDRILCFCFHHNDGVSQKRRKYLSLQFVLNILKELNV